MYLIKFSKRQILDQAIKYEFVDLKTVFGDRTNQKANANKSKHEGVEVEMVKKVINNINLILKMYKLSIQRKTC